jgi:N-acetylneuraminic acid mutarotase
MKKILITIILLNIISASYSQTIVWKEVTSLPEAYNGGEAVSLNNEIYFVAGRTKTAMSAAFYKFNPQKNQWTRLADAPKSATNFALAAVNGKIYAIGGDQFQDANREYDPKTDSWKLLTSMPTARQHINCGVYENEIYIAGGLTSWKNITKKHEVYDVLSDSWSEKAAIPSLRNNSTVVSLDSLIYVFGGAGTKDNIWGDIWTVETYNVNSDKWVQKNDLPQLLFGPGVTVVNNEIIILGGQTREGSIEDATTKVFIYKHKSDQWMETTPLPIKNVFFGCTSIGNKIYVIGGTVGGNPNWDNYSSVYEGTIINQTDDK